MKSGAFRKKRVRPSEAHSYRKKRGPNHPLLNFIDFVINLNSVRGDFENVVVSPGYAKFECPLPGVAVVV